MKTKLIAPCGMNCSICVAFLREKNKCPGCRLINEEKPRPDSDALLDSARN